MNLSGKRLREPRKARRPFGSVAVEACSTATREGLPPSESDDSGWNPHEPVSSPASPSLEC